MQDKHLSGRPLLVNMADPQLCFHQGLQRFRQLVLMSNVQDDRSVVGAGPFLMPCHLAGADACMQDAAVIVTCASQDNSICSYKIQL